MRFAKKLKDEKQKNIPKPSFDKFKNGEKVQIQDRGTWYDGKILEVLVANVKNT